MSYQFNFERALKKRIEIIKELKGFLNIELEMREYLLNEMMEFVRQDKNDWALNYNTLWM